MKEFYADLALGLRRACCCLHGMSGKLNDTLFTKLECFGLHLPLIPPGMGRHDWTLMEAKAYQEFECTIGTKCCMCTVSPANVCIF
jgi:hypothetical protein